MYNRVTPTPRNNSNIFLKSLHEQFSLELYYHKTTSVLFYLRITLLIIQTLVCHRHMFNRFRIFSSDR